jgi:hypothetical protein
VVLIYFKAVWRVRGLLEGCLNGGKVTKGKIKGKPSGGGMGGGLNSEVKPHFHFRAKRTTVKRKIIYLWDVRGRGGAWIERESTLGEGPPCNILPVGGNGEAFVSESFLADGEKAANLGSLRFN